MTIRAIYEGGVFRPIGPVDLPENSEVEFEPKPIEALTTSKRVTEIRFSDDPRKSPAKDAIYEILSRRYSGGRSDVSQRHNEHQP